MRFAITHPIICHPCDLDLVSGQGVAQIAQAAERAGFAGYGFTDHPAPTQRWLDSGGHDSLDPFVALGFAAAVTTTLRLVPNIVVLPYRNPFVVAKAAATLDRLSGGRFTLAVGAGYLKAEFAAVGVDHAERNQLFDEALDTIRAIWTGDDVSVKGTHFNARGVTAHPRPVSEPHPPIWIGGNSSAARARVARAGDGWCPFPAPAGVAATTRTIPLTGIEDLAPLVGDLHRRLEATGRDPRTVDVAFSNDRGGTPGAAGFDIDEHLAGLSDLADVGVTWAQVRIPGSSLAAALEAIDAYAQVISAYGTSP